MLDLLLSAEEDMLASLALLKAEILCILDLELTDPSLSCLGVPGSNRSDEDNLGLFALARAGAALDLLGFFNKLFITMFIS